MAPAEVGEGDQRLGIVTEITDFPDGLTLTVALGCVVCKVEESRVTLGSLLEQQSGDNFY